MGLSWGYSHWTVLKLNFYRIWGVSMQKGVYLLSVENELNAILAALQFNTFPGNLFMCQWVYYLMEKGNQTSWVVAERIQNYSSFSRILEEDKVHRGLFRWHASIYGKYKMGFIFWSMITWKFCYHIIYTTEYVMKHLGTPKDQ